MPEQNAPTVRPFGWPTHREYDARVNDPLPRRWVELIRELNERERVEAQAREQPSTGGRGDGGNGRGDHAFK